MAGGDVGRKVFALRSALTYIFHQKNFRVIRPLGTIRRRGCRGGFSRNPPPTKPNRDFNKKTLNADILTLKTTFLLFWGEHKVQNQILQLIYT